MLKIMAYLICSCISVILLIILHKTDSNETTSQNGGQEEDLELPLFSICTITTATDNFSLNNKLGEGGFGPVYRVSFSYANLRTTWKSETFRVTKRFATFLLMWDFQGKLEDGQEIAVKRLAMGSRQGINEFKKEVKVIANLQHWNLVKLLGCCIQGEEKLLVYEYMPNKSLDSFIFGENFNVLYDCLKLDN